MSKILLKNLIIQIRSAFNVIFFFNLRKTEENMDLNENGETKGGAKQLRFRKSCIGEEACAPSFGSLRGSSAVLPIYAKPNFIDNTVRCSC